ncbi:16S rRNA (guanine(966)-N(2))-methyltransferase RsmD [Buchnera aphidicola (Hormaphis cornu)]|nr:16S rRNA (guanine(966)-N(2))-methyltransferase RsmD [Buchnera aphidicola (Hormaphis cornu)]
MYKNSKPNNTINIISGKFKSRKIKILSYPTLRPTKNIIRETIFNWLSLKINKSRCLDCFAGSGSLGIEAISRNALTVTFIEKNRFIVKLLKNNLNNLNIKNCTVLHTDILKWLHGQGNPFDIIFIDPPFQKKLLEKIIILLENNHWVKNNTWIYIEQSKTEKLIMPKHWMLHKKKSSGNVCYQIYICNIEQ